MCRWMSVASFFVMMGCATVGCAARGATEPTRPEGSTATRVDATDTSGTSPSADVDTSDEVAAPARADASSDDVGEPHADGGDGPRHSHGHGHEHPRGHGRGHDEARDAADAPPAHASATTDAGEPDHYARRFGNAKRWSKSFDDPKRKRWQKPAEVVELMDIAAGMTVADIGAGTGYFVPYLSRAVGERGAVLALDVEDDMVRFLDDRAKREKLSNVTARVVPHDAPGLAPGSVDRVLIVNTWHHIGGRVPYSKKLASALRPDGAVVIVEYTVDAPRGPPRKHRMEPAQVIGELEAAGFDARVVDETLPLQFVVVATRR